MRMATTTINIDDETKQQADEFSKKSLKINSNGKVKNLKNRKRDGNIEKKKIKIFSLFHRI